MTMVMMMLIRLTQVAVSFRLLSFESSSDVLHVFGQITVLECTFFDIIYIGQLLGSHTHNPRLQP